MKIGFSGFSSSGKTSAAHELVSRIKRQSVTCSLVSGAARSSRSLSCGDVSLNTHLEIIGRQLIQELNACEDTMYTVCDRTMLDYLAYGECRGLDRTGNKDMFLSAKEFCRHFMRTFDVIFVVDGSFGNLDKDTARLRNDVGESDFMTSLDRLVEEFDLRELSVRVAPTELPSAAWNWVQERLTNVEQGR